MRTAAIFFGADGCLLDQDSSLLEFAWEELVEGKKDVNALELAKVSFRLIIDLYCHIVHKCLKDKFNIFQLVVCRCAMGMVQLNIMLLIVY